MVILMMLEILQQNLHNQLWFLPLTVVNTISFSVLLLVCGLIVPQRPDCLNQMLLVGNPRRTSLGQDCCESNGPKLNLCFLSCTCGMRRMNAQLNQLISAGRIASHHSNQFLCLVLKTSSEYLPLLMFQQIFNKS